MNLNQRQRQFARLRQRAFAHIINPPRKRKPYRTKIKKRDFIIALKETAGIKSKIAKALGISRYRVERLLLRPDWEDVRRAYAQEVETGVDQAEITIQDALVQREDIGVASRTAQWYLTKIRKDVYGDESKLDIRGGISTTHDVRIEDLDNVPLEVKRQLLEAIEAKERERQAAREAKGDL